MVRRSRQIVSLLLLCISLSCVAPTGDKTSSGFHAGVVASADSLATEAGLTVMKNGGNAFDAAAAVGFALAVTHPQAGNIGGGGFALLYVVDSSRVFSLDFRETAPAKATRDMYLDNSLTVVPNLSTTGFPAAGTPGTVAGLLELHKNFGAFTREQVLAPAIELAKEGFVVDSALAATFSDHKESLQQFSSTKREFFINGESPQRGDTLFQTDLANVLQTISDQGRDGFYRGEIARCIAEEMKRNNGLISEDDLAHYQPLWRDPIRFDFSTLKIYSMAPPSSGGVVMGEILGMLSHFDFQGRSADKPWVIHVVTEAFKLAYADRAQYLGDPDYIYNPAKLLLSPDYLYSRARSIDTTRAMPSTEIRAGLESRESENTTHFSIIDSVGNVVSLTYTLNSSFGCKQVVGGLGFFLNNEMDDFSIKPGVPNLYGLIGGEANAIEPGKRMLSSMTPTIVFYDNKPVMVTGTPGGSKIITNVVLCVLNFFGFGTGLDSAVNIPHYHHQWLPDKLYYEEGAFDSSQIEALSAMGHDLQQRSDYGDLQVIVIFPDGARVAVSDRRGSGYASGY